MLTLQSGRLRRGLTKRQLALLTGVTETTIGNWECGRYHPQPALKARVETTLNAAIDWKGISRGFEKQEATFILMTERFLDDKIPSAQLLRRVQRAKEIVQFFGRQVEARQRMVKE